MVCDVETEFQASCDKCHRTVYLIIMIVFGQDQFV